MNHSLTHSPIAACIHSTVDSRRQPLSLDPTVESGGREKEEEKEEGGGEEGGGGRGEERKVN